jgi:mono/diheme cytochrome c family protein
MSLEHDAGANGNRYLNNEYGFNPYRTRVKAGSRVTWLNNGRATHTIVAQDGSWTTGPLQPAQTGYVTFDKPGVYPYICKEHPWSYGQLIIAPDAAQIAQADGGSTAAGRGKLVYAKSCSSCHRDDLSGGDRAPALIGDGFWARWKGRRVKDLLDRIRTTMPQDRPGSLTAEAYTDILGYILNADGISADTEILK